MTKDYEQALIDLATAFPEFKLQNMGEAVGNELIHYKINSADIHEYIKKRKEHDADPVIV